jgi:hypothetical protein
LRVKYFAPYKSITETWTGAKITFRPPTLLFCEGESHWPIYSTNFSGANLGIRLTPVTGPLILKIIKPLLSDAGNYYDLQVDEEKYEDVVGVSRQNVGKVLYTLRTVKFLLGFQASAAMLMRSALFWDSSWTS